MHEGRTALKRGRFRKNAFDAIPVRRSRRRSRPRVGIVKLSFPPPCGVAAPRSVLENVDRHAYLFYAPCFFISAGGGVRAARDRCLAATECSAARLASPSASSRRRPMRVPSTKSSRARLHRSTHASTHAHARPPARTHAHTPHTHTHTNIHIHFRTAHTRAHTHATK
jgi:hypothetical protein